MRLRRCARACTTRIPLCKVARWDPDKRWFLAIDTVRVLKNLGWRPLLLARGAAVQDSPTVCNFTFSDLKVPMAMHGRGHCQPHYGFERSSRWGADLKPISGLSARLDRRPDGICSENLEAVTSRGTGGSRCMAGYRTVQESLRSSVVQCYEGISPRFGSRSERSPITHLFQTHFSWKRDYLHAQK